MKKFILLGMAVLGSVALSACGAGDVGRPGYQSSSAAVQENPVSSVAPVENYDDTLQGLINCMSDRGYISGDATAMSASIIGAKEGYKYQFAHEKSNVTVELYEYDLENLNDTATKVHEQVKNTGGFQLQSAQIPATLSPSGKYLMIYTYSPENDANQQRKDDVENLLKRWKS